MRKTVLAALVLCMLIFCASAFAIDEKTEQKGASPTAYEHASPQAIFNRVSDWFATIGKSPEEKAKMIEKRKTKRAAQSIQKETRTTTRELERTREEKGKKVDKPMKGWQKGK